MGSSPSQVQDAPLSDPASSSDPSGQSSQAQRDADLRAHAIRMGKWMTNLASGRQAEVETLQYIEGVVSGLVMTDAHYYEVGITEWPIQTPWNPTTLDHLGWMYARTFVQPKFTNSLDPDRFRLQNILEMLAAMKTVYALGTPDAARIKEVLDQLGVDVGRKCCLDTIFEIHEKRASPMV